ncbi:MAG: polysaccharide biosynthesis/export family protein [Bacteroidales bacterium]|nr:polysaccharide biosynthesis/export family protein [Bacteroidales bacterium]
MKIYQTVILVSFSLLLMNSCITRKKLTYLQYSGRSTESEVPTGDLRSYVTPATYRVIPYDNLYIRVITPDPEWSSLFNIMPVGAGGAVTEESAALFGYPVDEDGYIEIPFVGKVKVGDKTLSEIKSELDSVFKNYLTDAAITIRLVNNYVSVLGEVSRPGRYILTKDRVNIFEVLAMAGDMSVFSNRQKVQLIRPSPYGPIIKEFSLADRSIISSEYYFVMPNDIIYTTPLHGRSFEANSSFWSLFLSTITSALGVIAFFRTL